MLQKQQSIPYPIYTTLQRDALTNVVTNYIIYNSTTETLDIYNGTIWNVLMIGNIINPINNQILVYNETTNVWENIKLEKEWHLEFYATSVPIKLFNSNDIILTSVSTSNVISYEFSYDLINWVTPTFPTTVLANTPFTVRVTAFDDSAISANLIIKYTK